MNPFGSYSFTTTDPARPGPAPARPDRSAKDADRAFERSAPAGISYGTLGYGSGGPAWLDAYHSQRSPAPAELVNAVKNVAFACIGLNAKAVARVPLRLYAKTSPGQAKPRRSWQPVRDRTQSYLRGLTGDPDRTHWMARSLGTHDDVDEVTQHPILDALDSPNEYFDRTLFLQYLAASLDAVGTAYIYPVRPAGADGLADPSWAPSELWPLQAQYVYPVKGVGPGRVLDGYQYFTERFAPREVVRFRTWSLRDPYLSGYSPLHASYEQNGLVDYYTSTVKAVLTGGGRPDAVLTAKDSLMPVGDDEAERLEKELNKNQGGPNQGKIWVMKGAFDLKPLSYPPADLGGLELTRENRLMAANCFDVPIDMLQSEGSNRATASESSHKHQYYAVAPRCQLLDSALTHQLGRPIDPRLFLAFDDAVSRDVERDAKVFDMKIQNGSATINEARADEGKPPVAWGDGPPTAQAAADGKPAAAGEDGEPTAAGPAGQAAGDDVQKLALNGAQVSSMIEVVAGVRDGSIPADAAKALLAAAFPALAEARIAAIVDPIEVKEPPDPAPTTVGGFGGPAAAGAGAPPPGSPPAPDPARAEIYEQLRGVLAAIGDRLHDDPGPDGADLPGPGGADGPGVPGGGGGAADDGGPDPEPEPGAGPE